LLPHLSSVLSVSAAEMLNIFNSYIASRLSALESTPTRPHSLGPFSFSLPGSVYSSADKDGMVKCG
jgi:hypothetical protein